MMPPPRISSRSGTSVSSSAPSESITRGSSWGMKGGGTARGRGRGAAGDDRLVEADQLGGAVGGGHLELVGGDEAAGAADGGHLALAGQAAQAAGEALDHALLPVAEGVQVDLGGGEAQAGLAQLAGLGDHAGRG